MRILFRVVLAALLVSGCGTASKTSVEFHVSPNGNDNWTGLAAERQGSGSDGPFATLERAQAAVRELKQGGKKPTGGVSVIIHDGVYNRKESLSFGSEDSGTADSPVMWRAAPGETVILSGGVYINEFSPISDETVLARIDSNIQDKIVCADLKKMGIDNFGSIDPVSGKRIELYFKGKFMTVARYPDEGWLLISDVPQTGPKMINRGLDRDKSAVPKGRHYGRFCYPDDRPKRWKNADTLWVHGYWTWDWSEQYLKVAKLDTKKREVTPEEPHHGYGYTKGQRFYFLNILEELDSPGEWFLDTANGMLYFWPPTEIGENDCVISLLETPVLDIDEAADISFENFAFEATRGPAVTIDESENVVIAGCAFRNLGQTAVEIHGGAKCGVQSSDICDTAAGGVVLDGGDRMTLTPAEHFADNNHIHHFAHRLKTYRAAVQLTGVGNTAAHNLVHDGPHTGIFAVTSRMGNDHIIEYNELHSLAQETGDVGAIYLCARNFTMRGNIVRYNYLHDIVGPGHFGAMAIYLDDFTSGTEVYGNICWNASRMILIGGGRDNNIVNNVFIGGDPAVHVDARGIGWAKYYFNEQSNYKSLMDEVNYDQPPYSERYPQLLTLEDDEPAMAKYNVIERNISQGGRFLDLLDGLDFDTVTVNKNIVADSVLGSWNDSAGKRTTYDSGDTAAEKTLTDNGNIVLDSATKVVDPTKKIFTPAENSDVSEIGFEAIPVDKIGLYQDGRRTGIPRW